MPYYHKLGELPHKRHVQFRKPDGSLYAEELFSTEGFSTDYSLLYHLYEPTKIIQYDEPVDVNPEIAEENMLKHRSFEGFNIAPAADYWKSRKPVLVNDDVYMILAAPTNKQMDYFYKNADSDEVIFIHQGSGTFKSMYGQLKFGYGDYLVIPRGCTYQLEFDDSNNRLLIIESKAPVHFPKRYLSKHGQFLEHSPIYERDIKKPDNLQTIDEVGDFLIKIKKKDKLFGIHYQTHPFDVVGWDGFCYPYIFNILDFEPITGKIHQPPPVHQTFETNTFVICSFVPRLYDYHPLAIPAPYNHSNIDSDEVLYYVDGDFMSRKHVTKGMITLHPAGIPHGPHPTTVEKSIGKLGTDELAVMLDTFKPLKVTKQALAVEDPTYGLSWLEY